MRLRDDVNSVAADLETFMAALIATGDRRRVAMGLIACITTLIGDDRIDRVVTADALVKTAIDLDPDIKERLVS